MRRPEGPNLNRLSSRVATVLTFVLLAALLPIPAATGAASPTDAFDATWARSDAPVASGAAARTWMWGPAPISAPLQEPYAESPGGLRTVVYYDKSRMEVTQPASDSTSPWYVTNGLLARELISGEMQIGDEQWEQRLPAEINIAGDQGFANGPTYATFYRFVTAGEHTILPARRVGSLVRERMDAAGRVVVDERLGGYNVHATATVTGSIHALADPFWAFMTSRGMVEIDGALSEDTLFPDPLYATGLPLTDPFWAEVVVGGTLHDVLLQCFERRCLTYTPANPVGWQVESGNIGSHYRQWRYAESPQAEGELLFTRTEYSDNGDSCTSLYVGTIDGTHQRQMIPDFTCNIFFPQWSPDGSRILFTTDNDLFVLRIATMDLLRVTETPEYEWNATWSPDGTQIAAMRAAESATPQLILLQADGTGERVLAHDIWPAQHRRAVAWSPDGTEIAYLRFINAPGAAADDTYQAVVVMQVDEGADDGSERSVWEERVGVLGHLEWTADGRELLANWDAPVEGAWAEASYDWFGGALVAVAVDAEAPALRQISGCMVWPPQPRPACTGGDDGTIWYPGFITRAPDSSSVVALVAMPMFDMADAQTQRVHGAQGLFTLDSISGAWQQVTHYSGYYPQWSPDGAFLLFRHSRHLPSGSHDLIGVTSRDGTRQWVAARDAEYAQWRPIPVTNP